MSERRAAIQDFVAQHGWLGCKEDPIAGDASKRSYVRLTRSSDRAILMDADPELGEDVRPFVKMAHYLRGIGLSAPEIYAQDDIKGLLLLEDLGDDLYARLLANNRADEHLLYSSATDVLAHLHNEPPLRGLASYDTALMAELSTLATIWYRRGVLGQADPQLDQEFTAKIAKALGATESGPRVVVQRDYHAENLLWLPKRTGIARVGVLDFQSAMLGHPAYDLTSILQDARRDVPGDLETAMVDHYLSITELDASTFKDAYAALGLQRNLRIMGVFARLWLRDGQPRYLSLLPRVWGHVETSLDRLANADLACFVRETIPAPDPEALNRIKAYR